MDQSWRSVSALTFPPDEPVEWQRDFGTEEQRRPFVARWRDFPSEFNVAGLWWRPLSAKLKALGIS